MKRIFKIRLIFICSVILWMMLIFFMSSQDNAALSKISSGIYEKIADIINPDFGQLDFNEKYKLIESINNFFSKTAHLTEYFILGMLCMYAIKANIYVKQNYQVLISAGICLTYAFSDELHQVFVIGRESSVLDIGIDFCGSLVGMLFVILIVIKYRSIKVKEVK